MPAIDSVDFLQSGSYSARQLRQMWVDTLGEGVADAAAFLVSFSAGLTVNVAAGEAYIRGSSTADQGIYRCNNYSQRQVTLPAADTTERIDQIVLQVQDAGEDAGTLNNAQVTFVKGAPTAGATLDSRSGAASLALASPSLILLADVLVSANNSPAMTSANIRDRRPFASPGHPPVIASNRQQVLFMNPFLPLGSMRWTGSWASRQSAMAMYLPHRIPATHVRWRYVQDPAVQVATGQTWNIAICDASGRLIGQTGAVAFAGGTSTSQRIAAPFNPALPAGYVFDAGWYYVWAGISALGATQTCFFTGYS